MDQRINLKYKSRKLLQENVEEIFTTVDLL